MKTLNGFVMTEIYCGERKIQTKVTSGFASVQQKANIVKLKVLQDAQITYGNSVITIPKDGYVYVKEENLYTQKHLTQKFEISGDSRQFILLDFNYVVAYDE